MMITVLFYTFVVASVIQIVYYISFSFFVFSKDKNKTAPKNLSISVIICAKNEAKNLLRNLPSVINQKYQNFEIVLINDASSDNTLEVMEDFKKKNSNIKIVDVKNNEAFWGNKKYALTLGIKAAKNEHLLFTDADCKPNSIDWISEMAQYFSKEKTIILGYGKHKPVKNSFINLLVRFETLLTAIQYFSYAKLGSPYMGVGRNLAYTKSEFFKTNGFIKHLQIRSGDDDLFIQEAATKENTTISTSSKSFTISNAPETLKEWFRQKRRHISTAAHYKFKHQFFLGMFYTTKLVFLILAAILLFIFNWKIILPIVIFYFTVQYIIVGFSAKKLHERKLTLFIPFLEICLVLFQFTIFITNIFSKPTHWK